jgi:hypothetical protein
LMANQLSGLEDRSWRTDERNHCQVLSQGIDNHLM